MTGRLARLAQFEEFRNADWCRDTELGSGVGDVSDGAVYDAIGIIEADLRAFKSTAPFSARAF